MPTLTDKLPKLPEIKLPEVLDLRKSSAPQA